MFPQTFKSRLRAAANDLIETADVILAYEAPPTRQPAHDQRTRRPAARTPRPRRPGGLPRPEQDCTTPRHAPAVTRHSFPR